MYNIKGVALSGGSRICQWGGDHGERSEASLNEGLVGSRAKVKDFNENLPPSLRQTTLRRPDHP